MYDLFGNGAGTFALVGANGRPSGIGTDGRTLFVLDDQQDKIYTYGLDGAPGLTLNLDPANGHGTGISTDGTVIEVVDEQEDRVYRYDMLGMLITTFALDGANTQPDGTTVRRGGRSWIVDGAADAVYEYDETGVFVGKAFDLAADNERPKGIASFGPFSRRVTDDVIVLYEFEEESGPVVHDTSGFGTPLDLEIRDLGNTSWGDGALSFNSRTIAKSDGAATKVIEAMQLTDEITIEGWFKPANTSQDGPARIVTLSRNPSHRNFTLGQEDDFYDTRLRTTSTSRNGTPSLSTPPGSLTTDLTHVVYTRDHYGATKTYIDGVLVAEGSAVSTFNNWDTEMMLGLANEITRNRTWLGEMHLVALYNRALDPDEVERNFNAGP